jgi:hypothetical protein
MQWVTAAQALQLLVNWRVGDWFLTETENFLLASVARPALKYRKGSTLMDVERLSPGDKVVGA